MGDLLRKATIGVLSVLLLTVAGGGCAGGTSGTGGLQVRGVVLNTQKLPVAGATIMSVATGDSTITDANGMFDLTTAVENDEVTLSVDIGTVSGSATIRNIPAEAFALEIELELDEVSGGLRTTNVAPSLSSSSSTGDRFSGSNGDAG